MRPTADAPAAPKGAAAITHAPSTTQTIQTVTLTGTARAAMAEMAHTTAAPTTKAQTRHSTALSFWEPASSLLVCPDDAYAVNADLKQVCLQKALAIKALEEIVFRPEQPLPR
jgi:hypothetical protein